MIAGIEKRPSTIYITYIFKLYLFIMILAFYSFQENKVCTYKSCWPRPFISSVFIVVFLHPAQKHTHLQLPALSSVVNKQPQSEPSSSRKLVPLVQLHSFAQLLENMHHIEVISPRTNLWGLHLWGAAPCPFTDSPLSQLPQFSCCG